MKSKGTFTYFQNIIGWQGKPEIQEIKKYNPSFSIKPKGLSFKINHQEKWNKFKFILQPKKMKTLFAIDCSTSVRYNHFYFNELSKIMNEYYKEDEDIIYLWNKGLKKINKKEFEEWKESLGVGTGGKTDSSQIAIITTLEEEYREHLLIVTDGMVSYKFIHKCDEMLKSNNVKFKFVTSIVIGNEGNLSVGAPFCRNCPNITIFIPKENQRNVLASLMPDEIEVLNNLEKIDSYYDFIDKYEKLQNAIQNKMIGFEPDFKLIEKLNKLKENIINDYLNENEKNYFIEKINVLLNMAEGCLQNSFTIDSIAVAKCDKQIKKKVKTKEIK